MLKIAGTDVMEMWYSGTGRGMGVSREGKGVGKESGVGLSEGEFQALMGDFDRRMKLLRTIVEAGNELVREGDEEGETEVGADVEGAKGGEGDTAQDV